MKKTTILVDHVNAIQQWPLACALNCIYNAQVICLSGSDGFQLLTEQRFNQSRLAEIRAFIAGYQEAWNHRL